MQLSSLQTSQATAGSTAPAAQPPQPPQPRDAHFTTLDAQLSDLQCVLQEGGLSGEVRERGAEAVARARSALCLLAAEASGLRARLEEQEERRAMALAALAGTSAMPSAHTGVIAQPTSPPTAQTSCRNSRAHVPSATQLL